MKKPTKGLIALSSIGIVAGSFVVFIFMEPNTGHVPAYISMMYIVLNVVLLFLKSWARKAILAISWLLIVLHVMALPFAGQGAIGLLLMSPLLFYSIIAVIYLTRPKVKELFV